MPRRILSDSQWARVALLLPGKDGDPGRSARDNREFLEAVLWIARTGAPMARPARRVRAVELGVPTLPKMGAERRLRARFRGIVGRCRFRVRAHRRHHRAAPPTRRWGKRGTRSQAIGRSRGGPSTKISVMVDALGNLVDFVLLPGQRHDLIGVAPLLDGVEFDALIADKAYDSNDLRAELQGRGVAVVIPPRANRVEVIEYDSEMYKWRHLVEEFLL